MSPESSVAHHFTELEFKKPSDLIISQIRRLITEGVLKPGDRLPPERELAERFAVGRGHVRDAIKKLEFYGILKTYEVCWRKAILPQAKPFFAHL